MGLWDRIVGRIRWSVNVVSRFDSRLDDIMINQGILLSTANQNKRSLNIQDFEFKVFSQGGEDGIIQHLINKLEIKNKTFIEFGVANFLESNCRFLLLKDQWSGFVIDGSKSNIDGLRNAPFFWKCELKAIDKHITRENIDETLQQSGFDQDIGILSVDLDGNDYYILEAINFYKPRILICEYNALFGPSRRISIPYQENFNINTAHYSDQYAGASLAAMSYLADRKGYSLVGTNSAGVNAFFVRKDLINNAIKELSTEEAYTQTRYRTSRDQQGILTFLSAAARVELIKGMPVYEVERKITEPF